MTYFTTNFKDSKKIDISPSFSITVPLDTTNDFSVRYISLEAGRDPSDESTLVQLSNGFSALYSVFIGTFTFTIYEGSIKKSFILIEKDYIHITAETKFEIQGSGTIQLITFPGYTEGTFHHPQII